MVFQRSINNFRIIILTENKENDHHILKFVKNRSVVNNQKKEKGCRFFRQPFLEKTLSMVYNYFTAIFIVYSDEV